VIQMNQHFSCGIEAARCYFGEKVVERNDYELIPNAIEVNRFVFDSTIRNRIRHDNHLENKHIVGHVGRFMSQKNHTFLLDVFAEVSKRDSLAHLVLLGDGELMDAMKEKASNLGIKDRVTFVGNQIKNSLAPTAEDIRFSISADKGFRWLECRPQLFEKQQPDTEPKFDTEQQKAAYWIKHFLEKGDMSANEIYCRLDNEGVSKRVARMVKTEMGIHCYQKKRRWYWSVQPEEGAVNGPQV